MDCSSSRIFFVYMNTNHIIKYEHWEWTVVALNGKLFEKHRVEVMKKYFTHLYIFKDGNVLQSRQSMKENS